MSNFILIGSNMCLRKSEIIGVAIETDKTTVIVFTKTMGAFKIKCEYESNAKMNFENLQRLLGSTEPLFIQLNTRSEPYLKAIRKAGGKGIGIVALMAKVKHNDEINKCLYYLLQENRIKNVDNKYFVVE